MGLLMPALLLIAYVPLYSRSIHYIKDDPRLFDNVIKSSISTFIQLSFLALTRTLYQEKTSVFYSGLIERKFKEFERNSSFMDSFLQEIRDLAFKI
jgi:signal transduction histidine kinase